MASNKLLYQYIKTSFNQRTHGKEIHLMNIWNDMYEQAKTLYNPRNISPFIYGGQVVCAIESTDNQIYTGVCIEASSGVLNICAERAALMNMFISSGETQVKRVITFREEAPTKNINCLPCGACSECFMQFNIANRDAEFLIDLKNHTTVTLADIYPHWWGNTR